MSDDAADADAGDVADGAAGPDVADGTATAEGADDVAATVGASGPAVADERVWFVDRTDPDDGRDAVRLTYATTDGRHSVIEEREAGHAGDEPTVPASLDVAAERLDAVGDPAERERLAAAARRSARSHHPEHDV